MPGRLSQSGDFDDDVQVGGAPSGIDAFQRGHVRVVPADADTDVLLGDLAVIGGVEIPPTSGPGLQPGVALPIDGVPDHRVSVGVVITGHITPGNSHAAQYD